MSPIFPVQKLYRTGIAVWDLKRAVRNYTELYGIRDWRIFHFTPERLQASTFYGRDVSHAFSVAVGETPGGAATFELIQPGSGATTAKQLLYSLGESVHHLLLHAGTRSELRSLQESMQSVGIRDVESGSIDGVLEYSVFDTRDELGGFYLKAVATDGVDFDSAIEPDEHWDLSDEVSWGDAGPLTVPQLHHFGVVVKDVIGKAESYARMFGIDSWDFRLWHVEEGLKRSVER